MTDSHAKDAAGIAATETRVATDRWLESLEPLYASAGPCHDVAHVVRVAMTAETIARAEGVEPRLAVAAALLHDAGRAAGVDDHEVAAAAIAERVLPGWGFDAAATTRVSAAIRNHRFSRRDSGVVDELTAVLVDADRIDALGATGVARAFLYAGEHGRAPRPATADDWAGADVAVLRTHWNEKLMLLPDSMCTSTGARLARARANIIAGFLEQLESEIAELRAHDREH
ncbi:MAG TPA: HD domain-containing protein [Actinomycetota bacterium]|nr:HD domain-containing protein [Actinomycetota bacterium]